MTIEWTIPKLHRFTRAYEQALTQQQPSFHFEEVEFDTAYAGYLIEWMDQRFEQMEMQSKGNV
jgi:hypothetical protein